MRIDGISKAFGGPPVLHNISLSVPKGSIHGIIGKSGAGKTTLIRIAGLLEKPDSGSVWYEGIAAPVHLLRGRELLEARRKAGFVFQSFNLFASRSAAENVAFPLEAAGWPRAKIRGRVAELLELVGLSDKADRPAMQLSGGEKQRIAIARALVMRPKILILDDSTSSVDVETETKIQDALETLMQGKTSFVVAQRISTVLKADKIVVIDRGKIAAQGTHAELMRTSPIYQEIYDSQLGGGNGFKDLVLSGVSVSHGPRGNSSPDAPRPETRRGASGSITRAERQNEEGGDR